MTNWILRRAATVYHPPVETSKAFLVATTQRVGFCSIVVKDYENWNTSSNAATNNRLDVSNAALLGRK